MTASGLTLLHQTVLTRQISICIFEMEILTLQGRSQLLTSLSAADSSGCKASRIG